MDYRELRRIEETARVQTTYGDEVSPILSPVREIGTPVRGSKRSVGGGNTPVRCSYTLARASGGNDHDARLASVFRWRRAGYDFHRLNGFDGKLIGEDLALLVGDRLAVDGERIRGVVADAVEETIGIGSDSRRGQSYQR